MQLLPHTQQTQPAKLAPSAEAIAFKFARKPKLRMVWVTELVGDRSRLVAHWTTQD